MEILVKTPVFLALLMAIVCHSYASIHNQIPQHHKVRHKHNILHFNDDHVNEIREAFDEYKNTIYGPKEFDDEIKVKSLQHHRKSDRRLNDELTYSASNSRIVVASLAYPKVENSKFMTRYKRVQAATETTTQGKESESNYDDEYDDNMDEMPSKKIGDDSVSKVQVSCLCNELAGLDLINNSKKISLIPSQLSTSC